MAGRPPHSANLANYRASLDHLVAELGLEPTGPTIYDRDFGKTFRRYSWPAEKNGTDSNRTVLVVVHHDGSWDEYLSGERVSVIDTIARLRAMVKAP